ncbi:hypothetical protein [Paenibacillus sp. GCM10027626]|uniref:hypothetical protein n=1 Tax=Paenibacillus sp. GCM10027626 TaxID=3273411 RepID=UPI003627A10A
MEKMTNHYRRKIENVLSMPGTKSFPKEVVGFMMEHIKDLEKAGKEIADRMAENIAQLQREKGELSQELAIANDGIRRLNIALEKEREGKKVKLPRELADALERLRNIGISDYGIIAYSNITTMLWRDYSKGTIDDLKIVHSFQTSDTLLPAIVNGYTVEEEPTTEDKLRERFEERLKHYETSSGIPLDSLAAVLVVEAREVLAEDRQQE